MNKLNPATYYLPFGGVLMTGIFVSARAIENVWICSFTVLVMCTLNLIVVGWIVKLAQTRAAHEHWLDLRDSARPSAYLVLMLDGKQDPPVLYNADVFSVSAQYLTVTNGVLHVDLYCMTGESFREARANMFEAAQRWWPEIYDKYLKGKS